MFANGKAAPNDIAGSYRGFSRSTYVDSIYDPPRVAKMLVVHPVPEPKLSTAGRVEPDQTTVISTNGHEEPAGPPATAHAHPSCGCRRSTTRSR